MRNRPFLCAIFFLSGCSGGRDPASEPPVDLQAGLYNVSVGGGTVVEMKKGGRSGEICLDSYGAQTLPDDPLARIVGSWSGCSTNVDPRKGNALSGTRKCAERAMPMTATYQGSLTPDSFEIHGSVAQGRGDETASKMHLGSGDFTITGKRVGECTL